MNMVEFGFTIQGLGFRAALLLRVHELFLLLLRLLLRTVTITDIYCY